MSGRRSVPALRRGDGWIELGDETTRFELTISEEYDHPPERGFCLELWGGTWRGGHQAAIGIRGSRDGVTLLLGLFGVSLYWGPK